MARGPVAAGPPRAIAPGDIVVCFSDYLGEWTAAQVTDLDHSWKKAGVLDLDWSGPEPTSVDDLGRVSELVLTHHAWAGVPSHTNCDWILPRSYKVIGSLPPLRVARSNSYTGRWNVGMQLALQRRWDEGDRESQGRPGEAKVAASELDAFLTYPNASIWALEVEVVDTFDCAEVVKALPRLRRLALAGKLGTLANAKELNRLSSLRELAISNLFGMAKADCLLPDAVPTLEWLALHSVPREYGAAMRSLWLPEVRKGCMVAVTALRSGEWLAENLDNPLRDWDGRANISATKFRKSVAQYRSTRRAVLAALDDLGESDLKVRLKELGREYGEAFNQLSKRDDFIETEERDELFRALMAIPTESALTSDDAARVAGELLASGLDEVRDW